MEKDHSMLFGEEKTLTNPTWMTVVISLGTLAIGLLPKFLEWLSKNREDRVKDQDYFFDKYRSDLTKIQIKVDTLEKEHMDCQISNAKLTERCENQTQRLAVMQKEIDTRDVRIQELEK